MGKSRLAGALSDRDRLELNRFLFDLTVETVAEYPGIDQAIVVSWSEEVLDAARARGTVAVRERDGSDLNMAVAEGTQSAIARGACALFVLPVDLPLLTPGSLRTIVEEESGPVRASWRLRERP